MSSLYNRLFQSDPDRDWSHLRGSEKNQVMGKPRKRGNTHPTELIEKAGELAAKVKAAPGCCEHCTLQRQYSVVWVEDRWLIRREGMARIVCGARADWEFFHKPEGASRARWRRFCHFHARLLQRFEDMRPLSRLADHYSQGDQVAHRHIDSSVPRKVLIHRPPKHVPSGEIHL